VFITQKELAIRLSQNLQLNAISKTLDSTTNNVSSTPPSTGQSLTFMSGQASTSMSKDRTDLIASESTLLKTYSVHFNLKACSASICSFGELAELSFFLYSKTENRPISEPFLVLIDFNGHPITPQLGTIFQGLSARELTDSVALVCRIVRVGKMNVGDKDTGLIISSGSTSTLGVYHTSQGSLPPSKSGSLQDLESMDSVGYRRPFGMAVLEMSEVLEQSGFNFASQSRNLEGSGSKSAPKEYSVRISTSQESNFHSLQDIVLSKNVSLYEHAPKSDQICISLSFSAQIQSASSGATISGVTTSAHQPNPSAEIHTERMGYPEVFTPGYSKNSIYFTLVSGEFSARTTALSQRNVLVTLQVRNSNGEFIENCIYRGLANPESCYNSLVYYHSNSRKLQYFLPYHLPFFSL
jgi:dedicator of cytokinesis protein 3